MNRFEAYQFECCFVELTFYCEYFMSTNILFSVECGKFFGCNFNQNVTLSVRKLNL